MANQPESAVYDAGVYQLETTDPVQGGVGGKSNQPLLNLANRTAWLKQQVDALNTEIATKAPINSPTFTGSPLATTPPLGNNTPRVATTAFVQGSIGYLAKSAGGTGSMTLTSVEAGAGIIELTDALTGNRTVNIPAAPARGWTIKNSTTGAFTLTVKTPAGTGIVVPAGASMALFSDGTNIVRGDTSQVDLAGGTMTGFLTLVGAPTMALHAATKDYVDSAANNRVLRSGDTMTGPLVLPGAPTIALHAATKGYVDSADAARLPLAGGTMTGALTLGVWPSDNLHAAPKQYVDFSVAERLWLGGGTMTGFLTLVGAPTAANHAATKSYADGSGAHNESGHWQLSNGLIIQWGRTGRAYRTLSASQAITFPRAFPTGCFIVIPTIDFDDAGLLDMTAGTNSPTATGVTLLAGSTLSEGSEGRTFGWQWIAIGI